MLMGKKARGLGKEDFLLACFLDIPTILEPITGYRVVDKRYKKFTDFMTLVSVCLFARDFTLYISGRT